jgi:hypothetical protein
MVRVSGADLKEVHEKLMNHMNVSQLSRRRELEVLCQA